MIVAKLHRADKRVILAACDSDLLGKRFSEGDLQLLLDSEFYKGEKVSNKAFMTMMDSANIINLCGESTIEEAIKIGMVSKEAVRKIEGIPYVQLVFMD